jgi:tetratricopeptide (TPR) repeat protein
MKLKLSFLILLAAFGAEAEGLQSEFAAGRAFYAEGDFKHAVAHFQLALKANPADADSNYWIGMSYQVMADVGFPFAGKYTSKARVYLTKAAGLAPGRLDYRRELFDFLLDSAISSRAALRQAAGILRAVSPDDPDYAYMQQQFDEERKANAAVDARLARLFLAVPQSTCRIADVAVSALSVRPRIEPVSLMPK